MPTRLAALLVRSPAPVWSVLTLVTVVLTTAALGIRFDFSPQTVYATSDRLVRFSEQHKRTFGYEDAVVVVMLIATGDRDVLDAEALTWQAQTAEGLQQLPAVDTVRALPRLKVPRLRFQDGPRFVPLPLVAEGPVDWGGEQSVRSFLKETRLLDRALVSPDRRVAALVVKVDPDLRDIEDMDAAVTAIAERLDRRPPPDGYRVRLSGLPAVRVDIVRNLKANQALFLPATGSIFLFVFALMFRRVLPTVVPLLSVGMGLAWTIGVIAAAGQSFNLISNVLPSLMLVVGTSNCVHVVIRYAQHTAGPSHDRTAAATATMSQMLVSCLLTFLTTAAGFASILAARADVLRDFAWQSALGMVLLYASVMLALGSSLSFMTLPRAGGFAGRSAFRTAGLSLGVFRLVDRHPALTLLCGLGVVAGSLVLARNIQFDSYLMETYDADHPTMQTLRTLENQLGGALPLEINLTTDDPERFQSPQVYRNVAHLQRVAEGFDSVVLSRSYVDVLQELYARFRRRDKLRDELPDVDEEGRQRIGRSFALARRHRDVVGIDAFMTPDEKQARIVVRLRDVGTRRTLALIETLEEETAARFPPECGVTARLTSDAYLAAKALEGIAQDLYRSLLTASLIIFGIIAVMFRSLRLALIAAVVNLTPLAVTLGYMGLRGYDMTTGIIVVFAVSLGIAVDDTIHFLARFYEEFQVDQNRRKAIQRTFEGTGRAILLTTLLIVGGLAVLLTSEFIPTRRFAELTCLTMAGALVGDLLILPAALLLFWKTPSRPVVGDAEH